MNSTPITPGEAGDADLFAPFRGLEQELREQRRICVARAADLGDSPTNRAYHDGCVMGFKFAADKLAACLAALPILWTDAEYNALAKECKRLEDDREYNAALVEQRDEEIQLLRTRLAALPTQEVHAQCHDLVCNGDRRHPRGAKGVSCSCRGREERTEKEIEQLKAALGSPSEAWQPGQSNVTVRCVKCGREIWQGVPDYTTFEQARAAECSDCILRRIAPPARPADTRKEDVGA